jgi:hypothetical protein
MFWTQYLGDSWIQVWILLLINLEAFFPSGSFVRCGVYNKWPMRTVGVLMPWDYLARKMRKMENLPWEVFLSCKVPRLDLPMLRMEVKMEMLQIRLFMHQQIFLRSIRMHLNGTTSDATGESQNLLSCDYML